VIADRREQLKRLYLIPHGSVRGYVRAKILSWNALKCIEGSARADAVPDLVAGSDDIIHYMYEELLLRKL